MTALVLFEDEGALRFLPLTWTRPVFDLRCGILTLREAIEASYGRGIDAAVVRPHLADAVGRDLDVQPPVDGMVLMVNGRILADEHLADLIGIEGGPELFRHTDGTLLAARLMAADATSLDLLPALPETIVDLPLLGDLWQIVAHTPDRIRSQAAGFDHHLSPTATIGQQVVIDETDGPVVIDDGALLMPLSFIQGPAYVGRDSVIKAGARIYGGTSIGPQCRVGGEVEGSVFIGYANKQHDGFVGHSVIGHWCNLGAGTSNSDLKNTYTSVRVWVAGQGEAGDWVDSGQRLVGVFMADHAKSAINTSLSTGAVVGVAANIIDPGLTPKVIDSFAWGTDGQVHRFEEAVATARIVCDRRGVRFDDIDEAVLRNVWDLGRG